MLAESLPFQTFCKEVSTICNSIQSNNLLVAKFLEYLPSIIPVSNQDNTYELLYTVGGKLCSSADVNAKRTLLTFTEDILQKLNNVEHEYTNYLRPELEKSSKFGVWRLSRLTVLVDDASRFENDVYDLFSAGDLSNASEALCVLHPDIARRYIVKVLTACNTASAHGKDSHDAWHANAVSAIEIHNFDLSDPLFAIPLLSQTGTRTLQRLLTLSPQILSEELFVKLLGDSKTWIRAADAAVKSPFFLKLMPYLERIGCELNEIDFAIVRNCQSIPWKFLSVALCESREFLTSTTIEGIVSLGSHDVLYKLLLPRMNEKGSWRGRFNAVEVFKYILETSADWDMNIGEYTGFVVAMSLDRVYSVRKAAFQALSLFPSDEELSCVIEPLFSLVERPMGDLQLMVIRELLSEAKEVLLKNYKVGELAPILKRVNIDETTYFAGVQ
jgi:hypothetical protein